MLDIAPSQSAATWCVVTNDDEHYLVPGDHNHGFGPVNVWSNGLLVPTKFRHPFRDPGVTCPVCTDPSRARTYLPFISWETADAHRTGEPGSGDPDRGVFTAVFHGGPGHGRMWAEVDRLDWWHTWCFYASVDLDPHGDWRSAFDTWRLLTTGFAMEPERPVRQ